MRQLTFIEKGMLEWWDVPACKLQSDREAIVRPLAAKEALLEKGYKNVVQRD